jgi:hypothetical protein
MGFFLSQYQQQHGWVLSTQGDSVFFLIQFSHFATSRSSDHPQEDLAKSNYKTNRELETLKCLLHFGE